MIRDLDKVLAEGEGQHIEFKVSPDKELASEVVSFANISGGRVFIGITDKAKTVGTDISNAARSNIQDTLGQIKPHLPFVLEVHDNIIVIDVPEGKDKPYSCAKGIYVRRGPNSQKLDRDGIIEFMQSQDVTQYDSRVRNEYPVKERFNDKSYKEFISKAGISDKLPLDHVLTNLKCAALNEKNDLVFTNAGALFFRDNTEDNFFIHAKIVCAVFKGTGKAKVIDAKHLEGSIPENIDGAVKFLWNNLRVRYETKGTQRHEMLEIPEDALKEAVTNAACHRNYFEHPNVMIEVFDDRVEIHNPGGIPKTLSEKDFGKKSVPRNPIIADLLHRSGYIEKMGTGIKKMREAMEEANLEPPEFESTSFFTAIFKRPPSHLPPITAAPIKIPEGLNETEKKVYDLIFQNNNITFVDIAEIIGISESTVTRMIKSLTEKGIIERIGPRKGGSWKLLKV